MFNSIKSFTFVVRVLRVENGTWQGQIDHIQTGSVWRFRSCLEMLKIIDELVGTERPETKEMERDAMVQEA